MTWRRFQADPDGMMDILNNAVRVGPYPSTGLPVGGKTLIFGTPAHTVTFAGADDAMVPLADIISALAGVGGLHVERRACQNGPGPGIWFYLSLFRDGGFVLDKDGTANALFMFSADDDTVGRAPVNPELVKSCTRSAPLEYECVIAGTDTDFTG